MKGYQYLLKAIAQLLRDDIDVSVIILGNGPYRDQLEEYIEELGLGKHAFLPGERDDIRRILPHLDVFVQCSEFEGFSNSLMEAMQNGLPVVATNVGGNPEMVTDSETGLLIPWADVESLKQAILRLVMDEKLRTRLGATARSVMLKRFSVERMVDETEELYLKNLPEKAGLL